MTMLGLEAKRLLIDQLELRATIDTSPLYKVQVAYAWPGDSEAECVYGGGGSSPRREGDAEGNIAIDRAAFNLYVKIRDQSNADPRVVDVRAEAVVNAIAVVVASIGRTLIPNARVWFSGYQWENSADDDATTTTFTCEFTVEGYA